MVVKTTSMMEDQLHGTILKLEFQDKVVSQIKERLKGFENLVASYKMYIEHDSKCPESLQLPSIERMVKDWRRLLKEAELRQKRLTNLKETLTKRLETYARHESHQK
jgi:archaellum component FlaC